VCNTRRSLRNQLCLRDVLAQLMFITAISPHRRRKNVQSTQLTIDELGSVCQERHSVSLQAYGSRDCLILDSTHSVSHARFAIPRG
jgi:hypothetical protein